MTRRRNGKPMHIPLEYGTKSKNHSQLKEHALEEWKTYAQLLGM
jgi:hypothetical protein